MAEPHHQRRTTAPPPPSLDGSSPFARRLLPPLQTGRRLLSSLQTGRWVKKLVREKRLDAIINRNLNKNYDGEEVKKMVQVALLCTQATPEDWPLMSEVVQMLDRDGLTDRWEEWQQVKVTHRQEYERLHRRFEWGDDSIHNQEAVELSGGR